MFKVKITAWKGRGIFKSEISVSAAGGCDGERRKNRTQACRLHCKYIQRITPAGETIPYIPGRNELKFFNKTQSMEQKRQVPTAVDSQKTELLFSTGAFVAASLTLQWLKGNQTVRTYCHSSEPWGTCHKFGTWVASSLTELVVRSDRNQREQRGK